VLQWVPTCTRDNGPWRRKIRPLSALFLPFIFFYRDVVVVGGICSFEARGEGIYSITENRYSINRRLALLKSSVISSELHATKTRHSCFFKKIHFGREYFLFFRGLAFILSLQVNRVFPMKNGVVRRLILYYIIIGKNNTRGQGWH